jgi:hypothetical protein
LVGFGWIRLDPRQAMALPRKRIFAVFSAKPSDFRGVAKGLANPSGIEAFSPAT